MGIVALVGTLLVGCKPKAPTADQAKQAETEIKAGMAKCGAMKVPTGKTGDGSGATTK